MAQDQDLEFSRMLDELDEPEATGFGTPVAQPDQAARDAFGLPGATRKLIDDAVSAREAEVRQSDYVEKGKEIVSGLADPQQYAEFGKGIVPGAISMGGTAIQAPSTIASRGQQGAAKFGRKQLEIMDRIDRGEVVPETEDPIGYAHMSTEQRQAARRDQQQATAEFNPTPMRDRTFFKAGEAVKDFAKDLIPAAPGYEESVGRQLGEGMGSLVFGLPFAYFGAVPAGVAFGGAGVGEATQRAVDYDRKERSAGRPGLTEDQIALAGILGIGPGVTDLLPVEILMGRLPLPLPPALRRPVAMAIGRIGGQAFIEGVQEGGQAYLQNLIAREVYNPEQPLIDGIEHEMGIGAGVGGIAQTAKELGSWVLRSGAIRKKKGVHDSLAEPEKPTETVPATPAGEDTRALAASQEGPTPRLEPGQSSVRGAVPAEPAIQDAERLLAEIGGGTIAQPPKREDDDGTAGAPAVPSPTPSPTEGGATERVPTFNDLMDVLPRDKAGDADVVGFVERLGGRKFAELTDAEKIDLYREYEAGTPQASPAPVTEAPAAVPPLAATTPAETTAARPASLTEAIQQAAPQIEQAVQEIAGKYTQGTQSASIANQIDDAVRSRFAEVLSSKERRSNWGKAAGISPEQLSSLIQEAVSDGRLTMRKGEPVRTPKARQAAPSPQTELSRAATSVPMGRAAEVRLEKITSDVAYKHAAAILGAGRNRDAALKKLAGDKKATRAVLDEIHQAVAGKPSKSLKRKADVIEAIRKAEVAAEPAKAAAPETAPEAAPAKTEPAKPTKAGESIKKFADSVEDLKRKLNVKTRSVRDAGDIAMAVHSVESRALTLREQVDAVQRGSRLDIIGSHVAAFTSDANAIVDVVEQRTEVDLTDATLADLESYQAALNDLSQIVENRSQVGYDLAEQVQELRDLVEERLRDLADYLSDISYNAESRAEQLAELTHDISDRLDEMRGDVQEDSDTEADADVDLGEYKPGPVAQALRSVPEDAEGTVLDLIKDEETAVAPVLDDLKARADAIAEIDLDELTEQQLDALWTEVGDVHGELIAIRDWANSLSDLASAKSAEAWNAVDLIHDEQLTPSIDSLDSASATIASTLEEVEELIARERGEDVDGDSTPPRPLGDSYALRTLKTLDDPVVKGHYQALINAGTNVEGAVSAIASDRRLDAVERQQIAEAYVGGVVAGDPVQAIREAAGQRSRDITSALLHGFSPEVSPSNLRVRDFDAQMLETAFQRLADRLPRDAILAVRDALRLDVGTEIAALEGASLTAKAARVAFGINAGAAKKVIAVSLEYGPDTALRTFTHEEVHLLRSMGIIKGKDWDTLAGIAKRRPKKAEAERILNGLIADGKISQESYDTLIGQAGKLTYRELYEIDARYGEFLKGNEDLLVEETVAHVAADWANGRQFASPIERVFQRIRDFLESLQNAMHGLRFRSANDIFESIWAGELTRKFEEARERRFEAESRALDAMRAADVTAIATNGQVAAAFAGESARTADKEALARAKRMEDRGQSREDIWTKTGWFRGADRRWRFEIDDSKSKLRVFGPDFSVLQAELTHDPLFDAYPELADVEFNRVPGKGGEFVPGGIFPSVISVGKGETKRKSITLHESQHALQDIEGFAEGSNPDAISSGDIAREMALSGESDARKAAFAAYHKHAGEVESRLVQKRMDMSEQERRERPPWLDYDVPEADQIVRMPTGTGTPRSMSSVDETTGQSMRRDLDALGYYSQALEAAKGWQKKGTPEQALAWLKKSGVKDAEIEATGLKAFLGGKGSVTRGELTAHLERSRVALMESRYEGEFSQGRADTDQFLDDATIAEFGLETGQPARPTKWSNYSLDPDNPTYRETVLHLPDVTPETEAMARYGRPYDQLNPREQAQARTDTRQQAFTSGHFPEPNIIGHMMTSMTTHQGKPVYTIDQIQSDWGQRIRDDGVKDDAKTEALRTAQAHAREALAQHWPDIVKVMMWPKGTAVSGQALLHVRDMNSVSYNMAKPETRAAIDDFRLKSAELRTAEGAVSGNPLVNTTDQWVNTTLRRAIRQAAEADAEYIAIPSGETVLSYNPGDTHGMGEFYGKIVPKNLRNLLSKIDKASPGPQRIDTLDSPSGKTGLGKGFTLFHLTDKVKQSVISEGQPMFAFGPTPPQPTPQDESPGLNKVISDLKKTLGMTVSQGLWGMTVRQGGRSARVRPPSNVRGQFDRETGNVSVRQSRDIKTLAHEGGHYLESILGADLGAVKQRFAGALTGDPAPMPAALSEGFANWFRDYILDPNAAESRAPGMTEAFEELLEAERPDMLEGFDTIQKEYERYIKTAPIGEVAAGLSSQYDGTTWRELSKDASLDNISGKLSTGYQGVIDGLNVAAKGVSYLLKTADANGVRDADGRPISVKVGDNFYKRLRLFAGSFSRGRVWLEKGVSDLETGAIRGPGLKAALEKALGDGKFDMKRYKDFNQYLVSIRAIAEYDRLDQKASTVKQYDDTITKIADARRTLSERVQKDQATLDRRQDALTRASALLRDRQRMLGAAETRLENIQERLDGVLADIAEAGEVQAIAQEIADPTAENAASENYGAMVVRRRRQAQNLERDQQQAIRAVEKLTDEVAQYDTEVVMLEAETSQRREGMGTARQQLAQLDEMTARILREREAASNRGASRSPTAEPRAVHERVLRELGTAEFQEAAKLVHDFTFSLLEARRQAGFITQEMFDELAKRRDWYVPFWRDMSDIEGAGAMFPGSGVKKWSMFKKFDGSDRSILMPMEILSEEAYSTAQQIAFNDMMKAMIGLAERVGPGGGKLAERLARSETMEANAETFDKIKKMATDLGVDPVDAHMIVQRMEMNFSDGDIRVIMSPENLGPTAKPQLPLWENGERVMIRLPDPAFGRDLFDAINGLGQEMSDILVKALALPAQALRIGVTTHPDFIFRNIWRDIWTAWKLTGAAPFVTQYRGFKLINEGGEVDGMSGEDFRRLYNEAGGIAGGINVNAQIADSRRDVKDLLDTNVSYKAVAAGTALGGFTGMAAGAPIGSMLGLIFGGPVGMGVGFKIGASIGGLVGGAGVGYAARHGEVFRAVESVETATRLGVAAHAYKRAKEHNPDLSDQEAILEAAFVSRDIIDWNRRGSKMLAATRLVTFLNAQIQGLDKQFRQMGAYGDRGSALRKQLAIVFKHQNNDALSRDEVRDLSDAYKSYMRWGAITLMLMGLAALYADDDDYQDIKDETKATHSWFKALGIWFRLPKPFELGVPGNIGEIVWDKVAGRDQRMAERIADSMYEVLAPPGMPQVMRLTGGVLFNRDRQGIFAGRSKEIVGENLASRPPHERYHAFTSELAIDLSHAMYRIGVPQSMIPAPVKTDFVLSAAGAYWGREVQNSYQTAKTIGGMSTRPDRRATDFPILRGFTGEAARMSRSVNEMMSMISREGGEFTMAATEYKQLLDDRGRPIEAEMWLKSLDKEQQVWALTQYYGSRSEKREHPLQRAEDAYSINREIMRDTVRDELAPKRRQGRKQVRDFDEKIELTPAKKTEVIDILARLSQIEARNTMILLKRPGFEGIDIKDPQLILDELKSASPDVHDLLQERRDKKVSDWPDVVKEWPKFRERVLKESVGAF